VRWWDKELVRVTSDRMTVNKAPKLSKATMVKSFKACGLVVNRTMERHVGEGAFNGCGKFYP